MPIAKLFVEGSLDFEVLNPLLEGTPVLQRGGSKNSLKPRALSDRRDSKVASGYLRDRDFDFDPPDNWSKPVVDFVDGDIPIGWRWCRHEIENYLIDPGIVSEAMGWSIVEVEDVVCRAGKTIRSYEAARWTIGVVRRVLPPHYELETRPRNLKEIAIPDMLDIGAVTEWASQSIEGHRIRMNEKTTPESVATAIEYFSATFDDVFIADVQNVLHWFSGKDLLAGMAIWLRQKGLQNPGEFRALLRDWVRDNPGRALELLPEWSGLIEVLRA